MGVLLDLHELQKDVAVLDHRNIVLLVAVPGLDRQHTHGVLTAHEVERLHEETVLAD